MANEISASVTISVNNGNYRTSRSVGGQAYNQSSSGFFAHVLSVATDSSVNLTSTGIGTLGWIYIRNLDSTNYVDWGIASNHIGRLHAGETACFRLKPGVTLNFDANTAAVELEILVLEN